MSNPWQSIGKNKPQELIAAKLQMHYAVQFIAIIGSALAEPLPDYSHTSLVWNPELEAFVGTLIRAAKPFQVALDPVSLTSIILDKQGDTIATFPLEKQTIAETLNWHKQEIIKLGVDVSNIKLPSYPLADFPDYIIAHGGTFDTSSGQSERQELTSYYANTNQILQEIVATKEEASAIHIWPHHFDIATLITLSGTKNGEPMTIGIGMSPGDQNYHEPYWYVTPYPYPNTENLPSLDSGGFWHTQEWVGAVLTASNLTCEPDMQRQQITAFFNSAFQASQALLQA